MSIISLKLTINNQTNIVLILLFFFTQKKSFKKMVQARVGSGWLAKNTGRVMGQLIFSSDKKKKSDSG